MRRKPRDQPDEPEGAALEDTQEFYASPAAEDEYEEIAYEDAVEGEDDGDLEIEEAEFEDEEADFDPVDYDEDDYEAVDYDEPEYGDAPGDAEADEGDEPGEDGDGAGPDETRPREETARPGVGDRLRSTRKALEPLPAKARALWATLLAQARGVELPGTSDLDRRRIAGIALIVLACLVVGVGTYFIGKGSGDDVEAARQEGEVAGRQAGAIEGASEGYPAGFRKGRERGFRRAYVPAYRLNYKRAFEQAGLDVPTDREIEVPEP